MEQTSPQSEKLAFWETTGSVLWFSMDACWMLEAGTLALVLIVPTLLSNLATLRYTSARHEKLVTWAMLCWLAMNIAWMTGEILGLGPLLLVAKVFTALGFLLLIALVISPGDSGRPWYDRLQRFRRLRIP